MQHACHCPPSSRLSHEEAHKGRGMHARNLLLWGWREGVQVVPLLMADSISIKLRMCKKQYKQNGADPAGNWGEIWPWRSKVEFTPSPASHRAGPSTVIVRRWFHCCMKGTRSHQQDKCVGVGEFWDPGDPMLLPVVGFDICSFLQCVPAPHTQDWTQNHLGPDVSELPADTGPIFLQEVRVAFRFHYIWRNKETHF